MRCARSGNANTKHLSLEQIPWGNAVSMDALHVSAHSLALPLSLKMTKPACCDSARAWRHPWPFWPLGSREGCSLPFLLENINAQNERSSFWLFFGHQNVVRWCSRCYMIKYLFDQRYFVVHKVLKACIKHFRAFGHDLIDLADPQSALLICPARVVAPHRGGQDFPSSQRIQSLRLGLTTSATKWSRST